MRTRGLSAGAAALAVLLAACTDGGHQVVRPLPKPIPRAARHVVGPRRTGPPAAGFLSAQFGDNVHGVSVWAWNGRRIATVNTDGVAECCDSGSLSPDGTRLLVFGNTSGAQPRTQVLDTHGRVLAQLADVGGAIWADDSRHLCELRPHDKHARIPNGPADLVLIDPGHGEHVVARVPGYGPHTQPVILRCSIADDQAISADQFTTRNISITAVRLASGRTFTPKWVPAGGGERILAISGNGRYVLEPSGNGPFRLAIVDTATGAIAGHTTGQPIAVSWGGHLVLELANGLDLQVVDWRTGAVLWRSGHQNGGPGGSGFVTGAEVAARPHSDDLALGVRDFPGHDLRSAALWLVTPSQPPKLLDNAIARGII